jgi:hypothetical protein
VTGGEPGHRATGPSPPLYARPSKAFTGPQNAPGMRHGTQECATAGVHFRIPEKLPSHLLKGPKKPLVFAPGTLLVERAALTVFLGFVLPALAHLRGTNTLLGRRLRARYPAGMILIPAAGPSAAAAAIAPVADDGTRGPVCSSERAADVPVCTRGAGGRSRGRQ